MRLLVRMTRCRALLVATALAVALSGPSVTRAGPARRTSMPAERIAAKKLYRVKAGPYFNNPHGSEEGAKFRIERQVIKVDPGNPTATVTSGLPFTRSTGCQWPRALLGRPPTRGARPTAPERPPRQRGP